MIRVLHINLERTWRGGERQVALLSGELERRGIFSLIVCRYGSALHRYCERQGLAHHPVFAFTSCDPLTVFSLVRLSARFHVNLLHAHGSRAHTSVCLVSRLSRKSVVVHRRVLRMPKLTSIKKWKYNARQIKKYICVSDAVKELHGPLGRERLVTVRSGVDLRPVQASRQLFRQFDIVPGGQVVSVVTSFTKEKAPDLLLQVLAVLLKNQPGVRIFVMGDGSMKTHFAEMLTVLGIYQHVCLAGRVDPAGVRAHLAASDLLLFITRSEGLGTTILDAQVAGVPVVASKVGGVKEVIKDGYNGMLCENDPVLLANACESVLLDRDKASRLSQNAKLTVQGFSKEEMTERTLAIYNEVLAQ